MSRGVKQLNWFQLSVFFHMNHLYPHFINQMKENGLPLDCSCSTLFNQEDPFFLVRCEHSLTHEDHHHHLHSESKNHLHQSTTDSQHSSCKISLRREKEKTSIKHLHHQKSTPLFLLHKQFQLNTGQKTVKGIHSNQERRNPEINSIRHSFEYPLPTHYENLLQHHSYQQVQSSHQTAPQTPMKPSRPSIIDTHHLDVHPKIHFSFESAKEPLSRCQSEKLLPINSPCPSQRTKENPHSSRKSHQDKGQQENVQIEEHLDFHKKKCIKTKMSYDTNCSESSHIKENLHFVREEILDLMGPHINGKKNHKEHEKSRRGLKNMSELDEVKSVMDESEQESDGESIVLGKLIESDGLGLFSQFQEPEQDDSFRVKRRFTLKNF